MGPRGVPQIEVAFDIDANGIVNVSASDKATGKEQNIVIQSSGGLSDDEIERMVQEAEANKEADEKRKAGIEAKNDGDALVYSTEKSLSEHGDKLEAADKDAVEKQIADLKALEGDDVDDIKAKTEALQQGAMKIGEAMYKDSGAGGAEGGAEGDAKDGETVVDAEFKEKGDEKKEEDEKK